MEKWQTINVPSVYDMVDREEKNGVGFVLRVLSSCNNYSVALTFSNITELAHLLNSIEDSEREGYLKCWQITIRHKHCSTDLAVYEEDYDGDWGWFIPPKRNEEV